MTQRNRTTTFAALLAAAGAAACNCGDDGIKRIKDGAVTITSPEDGASAATNVNFAASATSSDGLKFLALQVGTQEIASCAPGDDDTSIECAKEFNIQQYVGETQNGALVLTAVARDGADQLLTATVTILAAPLTIKFEKPVLTQFSPPLAKVKGSGPLTLTVDSIIAVDAVAVTVDDKPQPIAQWRGTGPYTATINWARDLGTGEHVLHAQARDTNGAVAKADRPLLVSCGSDNDCAAGSRCCTDNGKCNPIVGPGQDCDCDHPCPTDQGCFPGTCGLLPRKCRKGCFPGGQQRGQYAERCANEPQGSTTVPAYCTALPASEATAQNKGGACAPLDPVPPNNSMCSIARQDCPDAPLDKNSPEGPNNPKIKYTCVPASPKGNICLPAGNIPSGGTGCEYDTCGDTARACQRGMLCVTLVDQNGTPQGPPTCRKQCSNPDPLGGLLGGGSPECNSGEYCGGLLGPGLEEFPTGSCTRPGF